MKVKKAVYSRKITPRMSEPLHIKNMVCHRCELAVEEICRDMGIEGMVSLGQFLPDQQLSPDQIAHFAERLQNVGLELIREPEAVELERIKAAAIESARHYGDCGLKMSACIEQQTGMNFRTASRIFSESEGRTLREYVLLQRVEYVKELLDEGELSLADIAFRTGFSSVAHLSRAFKRTQGVSVTEYRANGQRKGLDEV